jgi:integrase
VSPPTVTQVQQLLHHALEQDPEWGLYLWLLAATGCRRGEACALRWSDIDLDRAELRIRRSIAHAGSEVYEKSTKTHQSRRVALDVATVDQLRTRVADATEHRGARHLPALPGDAPRRYARTFGDTATACGATRAVPYGTSAVLGALVFSPERGRQRSVRPHRG